MGKGQEMGEQAKLVLRKVREWKARGYVPGRKSEKQTVPGNSGNLQHPAREPSKPSPTGTGPAAPPGCLRLRWSGSGYANTMRWNTTAQGRRGGHP
jgi:hypothetical protein